MSLLVVWALLAAIETVAPEPCSTGGPLFAAARMSGLGPGPSGVLIAIWSDGRFVRARDTRDPSQDHLLGRLSHAQLLGVVRTIEASGYWKWKQPDVAIDLPDDLTVACLGTRSISRRETVGLRAMSPGQRVTHYVLELPLLGTEGTRVPELWIHWFAQRGVAE